MADSGRKVAVRVGDRVVLQLPENPTTGVRWLLDDNDAVEIVDDSNVAGGPGIGADGLRQLTLRPRRPGPVSLKLLRRQAWESEATADARFQLELEVS